MRLSWLFLAAWLVPFAAWGLLPLQTYQDLVAGETSAGYRDGPFYSALFHNPQGLAFNPDGTELYIADRDNHCIRVVDLQHGNQVFTLAGNGKAGYADGPLSAALFNQPTLLAYLPGRGLVVCDQGNFLLRLIDLDHKTVTTLAGNRKEDWADGPALQASFGQIWSMTYLSSRNGLYFSGNGSLRKLDLKTGQVLTVFKGKAELPSPGALTAHQGQLYAADKEGGQVYRLSPKEKFDREDEKSFDWTLLAKGQTILQMAWSGGVLYAVQRDPAPLLARLTPQYQPVTFDSLWGDTLLQGVAFCPFLTGQPGGGPFYLAPNPDSERKLYFTLPSGNSVVSYRDLFQQELKFAETTNEDGLTDFRYPTAKPPGTFRILVIGDSHTFHQYDDDVKKRGWEFFNRFATLSKRTEETLNTLAALQDVPWHFEVLHYGQVSGNHLAIWPYYVVPPLVKKFDVDLVVDLYSPKWDFYPFYLYPYTSEGIPASQVDNEFLLKPVEKRVQAGLPLELLDLLKAKNLASVDNGHVQIAELDKIVQFPDVEDKTAQLMARPTRLLGEKLNSMRTSDGKPVHLEMALLPFGRFETGNPEEEVFWGKFLKEVNAPTLDLTSPMAALRFSYYPLSQVGGYDHFNGDGHLMMGLLLAEELIQQKLVPFEPVKK